MEVFTTHPQGLKNVILQNTHPWTVDGFMTHLVLLHVPVSRSQLDNWLQTCSLRESMHGGMLVISIFVSLVILPSLPRFALRKWNLSSFTLLNRGFPNNTHVSSSASHNISSRISQLSPSLANIALNFAFFCKTLMGFTFPIPLKALQVSHNVKSWRSQYMNV